MKKLLIAATALLFAGQVQAAEVRLGSDPGAMGSVIEGLITGIGFIGGGAILKLNSSIKSIPPAGTV